MQRLALARALACEADLLLADDVSSALDAATEIELWAALRSGGATVIGATSKAAALAQADRVVVLERGRVVDDRSRGASSPRDGPTSPADESGPGDPVRATFATCGRECRRGWDPTLPRPTLEHGSVLAPRLRRSDLMAAQSPDVEHQWAAEKRDFVGDRRDELADERDVAGDLRDLTADAREQALDRAGTGAGRPRGRAGSRAAAAVAAAQRVDALDRSGTGAAAP